MATNLSSETGEADLKQFAAVHEPDAGTSSQEVVRQESRRSVSWRSTLPLVPIGAVALFTVIASSIFIAYRLLLPYPVSSWEAGIVTDAWRMLQGSAIYAVGGDHATHMYGPLVTMSLAQAFRFMGPVLHVGRVMSAISGIAVVVLLARLVLRRSDLMAFGAAAALLLAANSRTSNYFTETRPDMDSLFFTTLALIVLYCGLEPAGSKPRFSWVVGGTAFLVLAVLFKQTAAIFMLVPGLALAGRFRRFSFRNQALAAAIPIAGVLLTFVAIRQLMPGLWHFMVEVPAQYPVPIFRVVRISVQFLATLPLFLLAVAHWLFTDAADDWESPLARWMMAGLFCAIPSSIIAAAKEGGTQNSLIPALLGVGAFCAWRSPAAFAFLRDSARPLVLRIATGVVFAIFLFAHVYPFPGEMLNWEGAKVGAGVVERAAVIAETRSLPGRVICPDDPTIPLVAKGYAGRTAVFEADAVHWDLSRNQALAKEIDSADYVILMRHGLLPDGREMVTTNLDWATNDDRKAQVVQASGFTKEDFRTSSVPVYELWRRTSLPPDPLLPLSRR